MDAFSPGVLGALEDDLLQFLRVDSSATSFALDVPLVQKLTEIAPPSLASKVCTVRRCDLQSHEDMR